MATKAKNKDKAAETQAETVAAPEFNLGAGNLDFSNDEELNEELAKSGGKYFDDPGNVDLKVIAADFHKNKDTGSIYCPGDSTWFNVVVTFQGAGDKEIRHWIQVPTTKIKFGKKDTLAVFKKLQQFFFALGEEVTVNSLGALCAKYFKDPGAALVGVKVNADLGFEGPYVGKLPESEDFGIFSKDGKPVMDDGQPLRMPDRASAVQVAKGRGIEPGFVKIMKFTASKTAPAKSGKAPAKSKGKEKAEDSGKKTAGDDW